VTPLLADASGLVTYLAPGQPGHDRVVDFLVTVRGGLVTTSPAFTEAMYLMYRLGGYRGQQALWTLRKAAPLETAIPDWDRAQALMHQYHDTPMDLAHATLVALAESCKQRTILSLDSDFLVYRIWHGRRQYSFRLVPDTSPAGS
jgi:predicted nucleic acid-binding protein